ncbi:MAG: hypothetical protein IJM47_08790 [Synergistaceae bacterium]|nr:hypothetical protein [Synergistaceae bacterium]
MWDSDKRFVIIWTLAGGYLVYLGDQLMTDWFKGVSDIPFLALTMGVLFLSSGLGLLFMAWRKWKKSKKEED